MKTTPTADTIRFTSKGRVVIPLRRRKQFPIQVRARHHQAQRRRPPMSDRTMQATKHALARRPLTPAGRALRRSALVACKIARAHGTPIYCWRDGKVVAEKP